MNDIVEVDKDELNLFLATAAADDKLIACLQQMDKKINDLTWTVQQLNINNTALKQEIATLREHIKLRKPETHIHNLTKESTQP